MTHLPLRLRRKSALTRDYSIRNKTDRTQIIKTLDFKESVLAHLNTRNTQTRTTHQN